MANLSNPTQETWKDIEGYEGIYQVSNIGNVRNLKTNSLKKLTVAKNGYKVVGLWRNNTQDLRYVHDLVAISFIGEKKNGLSVNHKSFDRLDNSVNNLEYLTLSENTLHQFRNGRQNALKGSVKWSAKLNEADIIQIRELIEKGNRLMDIANMFGVNPATISNIKARRFWKHI